jgi:hypothetical protein
MRVYEASLLSRMIRGRRVNAVAPAALSDTRDARSFEEEFYRRLVDILSSESTDLSDGDEPRQAAPFLSRHRIIRARVESASRGRRRQVALEFARVGTDGETITVTIDVRKAKGLVEHESELRHRGRSLAEDAAAFYSTMIHEALETAPEAGSTHIAM